MLRTVQNTTTSAHTHSHTLLVSAELSRMALRDKAQTADAKFLEFLVIKGGKLQ